MKTSYHNKDLNDLISGCKKGDNRAQMELYKRYYKSMYNISLRIVSKTDEAEDIMQESFLSAFEKIETYRGEVAFGAWLKKIVINKSLDVLKTRKSLISLDSSFDIADDDMQESEMHFADIDIPTIKNSIMNLPEGYRIVLSLYLIEGYDHEEISQILNISNSTSRTQYHRAKKMLANKLNELKAVS